MREHGRAAWRLLRRALAYELNMWWSLYRWLFRRTHRLEQGAEAFSYVGVVKPIIGVLTALSAIEIPILDLILKHTVGWPSARRAAVALGIWGVLWMIGIFAGLRIHPHLTDDTGLRVRSGFSVDFLVPWTAVARIDRNYRSLPSSRTVQIEQGDDRTVLNVGTGSQTAVDVVLREPLSVPLPKGPSGPVTEIRLYADDPDALVTRARRHLPVSLPRSDG